jgi:hypothetical protein
MSSVFIPTSEFQGVGDDTHPPGMAEKESLSDGEPPNRNHRISDNFLFWNISGRGQLLNRGMSLLSLNNSMGR